MGLVHRGEYPTDWSALSRSVKQAAGFRCVRCGHPYHGAQSAGPRGCDSLCTHERDGKQRVLTVHHLDGDKGNCRWWNLLALCQVCHLVIQAKVDPERPYLFDHSAWFRPYVAGFYAYYYAELETTREEVEAAIVRFLEMGQPWLYEQEGAHA